MADLVTHAAIGYLAVRPWMAARGRVLVYVGCVLPDVCARAGMIGTQSAIWFTEPLHSLWGAALVCLIAAQLFAREERAHAFACLLGGYVSHLLVDLGKDHLGSGAILLLFPWVRRLEISLYRPEQSVDWMPWWIGTVCLVEIAMRRREARRAG